MSLAKGVGPQTNEVAASSSCAVTIASTTAGRGLVALIYWFTGESATLGSVTVGGESNMTILGSPQAGTFRCQMAYLGNNTGGGSRTVTANFPGFSPHNALQDAEFHAPSSESNTTDVTS